MDSYQGIPQARATAQFSRRPPSPPHIHTNSPRGDYIDVSTTTVDRFAREGVISDEELRSIFTVNDQYTINSISTWDFDMRRQAQQIIPNIYLGPLTAAKDRAFLRQEGITMLMAVRSTQMTMYSSMLNMKKVAAEEGIVSTAIDIDGSQSPLSKFQSAIVAINDHLLDYHRQQANDFSKFELLNGASVFKAGLKDGKVLVFCETGNDRSVAVVVAYLMVMCGFSLDKSLQIVWARRFCSAVDNGTKQVLKSFEGIIQARVDVGQPMNVFSASSAAAATNRLKKRGYHDDSDTDVNMDEDAVDDRERFDGRTSFAPYTYVSSDA